MKRAIFSVCPDPRQESLLAQVLPSWERFAKRHGLDIIIVRRSITGAHPYWDRWMCFDHEEAEGYDQLLLLDNDVWISDNARNPFDFWSAKFVGAALESRQSGWDPEFIRQYYPGFLIELSPEERDFGVFNFGITLVDRSLKPWFEEHFQIWKTEMSKRFAASTNPDYQSFFIKEADGPFMSWQLQRTKRIEEIPDGFNRLIWNSYAKYEKWPRPLLLIEAKASQITKKFLPRPLWRLLFIHGRHLIRRCVNRGDFLHFAGSKSPMWLLESTNGPNPPA